MQTHTPCGTAAGTSPSPAPAAWDLECVADPARFAALAPAWEELRTAAGIENVFLGHRWLSEWWRVYGDGRGLRTLVVRGGAGRVAGIVPLVLDGPSRFAPRTLRLMGTGEVTPNHLDVIAAAGDRDGVIRAAWSWLSQHRSGWDVLDLEGLLADSPSVGVLSDLVRGSGLPLAVRPTEACSYALLPPSFEEFLQSRGSKTRSQMRYQRRRLERDFPDVRFADAGSPEEFEEVFEAFIRLHRQRWSGRGESDSFASSRLVAFHRAVARAAFDSGTLRLYHIRIGGSVVAVFYCFRAGSRLVHYNAGFDDRLAKYSLGIMTLAHAIEQAIAEGAREFDFLQGEEGYKRQWSNAARQNLRLTTHAPHARGRLAWLRVAGSERLERAAKALLSRETRRRIKRLASFGNGAG